MILKDILIPFLLLSCNSSFVPPINNISPLTKTLHSVEKKSIITKRYDHEKRLTKNKIPVNTETVEFTSGIIGGFVGYIFGGAIFSVVGAAAANYISKSDIEYGFIVKAVSKSFLHTYNFFVALDSDLHMFSKARSLLRNTFTNVKVLSKLDSNNVTRLRSTLSSILMNTREINDRKNVSNNIIIVLGLLGDFVEKIVGIVLNINNDHKLTDRTIDLIKGTTISAKGISIIQWILSLIGQ